MRGTGTDRCPGRPDLGRSQHRGGLGPHPATPFRPPRSQPFSRRPAEGLRTVRGDEFGALWTGDGLDGPIVAGRKTVLCAFIDDWSRTVPGWRWGHAEDTVRLEAALRRASESQGIPERSSSITAALFPLRSTGPWPCWVSRSPTPGRGSLPPGKSSAFSGRSAPSSWSSWTLGAGPPTWPSSTSCSAPGSRASITGHATPRPDRRRWSA